MLRARWLPFLINQHRNAVRPIRTPFIPSTRRIEWIGQGVNIEPLVATSRIGVHSNFRRKGWLYCTRIPLALSSYPRATKCGQGGLSVLRDLAGPSSPFQGYIYISRVWSPCVVSAWRLSRIACPMVRRHKVSTLTMVADARSGVLINTLKDRLPSSTKLVNCTQFGYPSRVKLTVIEYTMLFAAPGRMQGKLVLSGA